MQIDFERCRKVTFLTGAGISVASGLSPFRGPGGIWEELDVESCATAAALERDPTSVWRFIGPLRREALKAEPNPAHLAITALQQRLGKERVRLITQNIDGLHQRAGTEEVIELHGSGFRSCCIDPDCSLEPFFDDQTHLGSDPKCERCGSPLRPDAVLFNEPLDTHVHWRAKQAIEGSTLFIAIGTSGLVRPASTFARLAHLHGARTLMLNVERMTPRNPYFDEQLIGPAEVTLPNLLAPVIPAKPHRHGEERG